MLLLVAACDPVGLFVHFDASAPVPEPGTPFPLRVGDRWTWAVSRQTGGGPRVLLIQAQAARTEAVGTWTLSVERQSPDGTFTLRWTRDDPDDDGEPRRRESEITLWERDGAVWMDGDAGPKPAITMERPPMPISLEEVPCVVHFLDDLIATCSPSPGGPLDVAPGPRHAVLARDPNRGRALAQWVVGLATAGLIIPGDHTATTRLDLQRWEPAASAPTSERVEFARRYPHDWLRTRAFEGGIHREEAVAIVHLAAQTGDPVDALVDAAVHGVAPPERPSVVRALLAYAPDPESQLRWIAKHTPFAANTPDALGGAVVRAVSAPDQAAAAGLVRGAWPAYRAMLIASERFDLPRQRAALYEALRAGPPQRDEAVAIAAVFPEGDEALDALYGAFPVGDRVALAQARADVARARPEAPRDAESVAGAQIHPSEITDAQASAWIAGFADGEDSLDAAGRLVDGAPPHRKIPLLEVGLRALPAEQRLHLLARVGPGLPSPAEAWTAAVRDAVGEDRGPTARAVLTGQWPVARAVLAAPERERWAALTASTGLSGRDEAFAVLDALPHEARPQGVAALAPHLPVGDRGGLITHACAAGPFDDDRQRVLEANLDLASGLGDAGLQALLQAWSFDAGVSQATEALLRHAPAGRRGAVLTVGVATMRFDEAKMKLLHAHSDLLPALTEAQRSRILTTFDFDRAAASRLLASPR
jgi:hypothetical protein